jgi:bacillolysin
LYQGNDALIVNTNFLILPKFSNMKKTKLTCSLAFLLVLLANSVFAQFVPKAVQTNNTIIQGLTDKVESAGWLYFKHDAGVDPDTYFDDYATAMGLGSNDEMVEVNKWYGEGQTHIRFKQYHKSIPVKGGEYTMHLLDCNVKLAHGKIVEQLNVTLPATLSEATALQAALNAVGATTYAWQNADWQYQAQEDTGDPNATWYPKGELEIYGNADVAMTASNFNLAYRFEILAISPYDSRVVYVNAHTGQILSNRSNAHYADGTCSTLYYGTRTIQTDPVGNHFRLRDNTRGDYIWTKKINIVTDPWAFIPNVEDDNNSWGTPNAASTTSHWAAEKAWDYYLSVWGRNGINGSGRGLRILANSNLTDSYYKRHGKDYIEVAANGGPDLATLDFVGHEFTHGVVEEVANLADDGEAAALQESFCDIFGEAVERDVIGNDWLIAADAGTPIRDLASPNMLGHPDTYLEACCWDTGGAPHTNCGVQNRWFNLLTVGGTQNSISVSGLGFDKADRITRGNLINNMQSGSTYADARAGAIAVATAIWGPCSNEVIQTTNAWAACGVGAVFSGNCVFNITGPGSICINYVTGTWIADVLPGVTVTWSYPTWWNVTISGDGNRKLTVNSFSPSPPISTSVVITATSSSGASDTHNVWVTTCLKPPCDNGGERSSSTKPEAVLPSNNIDIEVTAFPNPSTGNLSIITKGLEGDYKIEVVNMLGNVITEGTGSGSIFELNLDALVSGTYYLRIQHPKYQKIITFIRL